MVVLSAAQVRAWDQYTMANEPVTSIDLMERAAQRCVDWMEAQKIIQQQQFYIFCGKGNNGGDGLAIARLLFDKFRPVDVFILEYGQLGSPDFQHNLQLLNNLPVNIHFLQPGIPLPKIPDSVIIIDALLGTGINRPVEGRMSELIKYLNNSGNPIISIDLPSGLFADESCDVDNAIHAYVTLSFQCYKPAFFLAENATSIGAVHILDIALDQQYLKTILTQFDLVDHSIASSIVTIRDPFSHKGKFGHALLLAGSEGKMGAAILAAKAVLRSGGGLLTCLVPRQGLQIIQSAFPEAMALVAGNEFLSGELPPLELYKAIGCGPGIGTHPETALLLEQLILEYRHPMVFDADAINLLAQKPDLLGKLTKFSILSPHPREFDRLAGPSENESQRWQKAMEMSRKFQLIIILKGHHSLIAMPGGKAWFNTSGNASMAKGGSGDILTGMLTGLLARGYSPEQTALLGVFLHGVAGEISSTEWGMESVLASDIINNIGKAFLHVASTVKSI